jgi:hypothetical protein
MTAAGRRTLDEVLARLFAPPPALMPRLSPILAAELYDTAVREMSVALEVAMREASNAGSRYGKGPSAAYTFLYRV